MGLEPEDPGDRLYRFEAPELKELNYRLAAQTYRFLQQHPQVVHWTVLVITPHDRLNLGPTEALRVFLEQQVRWLSLEALSREPDLDPLLNLLTLPTRPKSELEGNTRCWCNGFLSSPRSKSW